MRLVDADALLDAIASEFKHEAYEGMEYEISAKAVARLANEAPTVMQWVSVEEKLPESGCVLVFNCGMGAMEVAYYGKSGYGSKKEWLLNERELLEVDGFKVTHWMPLPPPPGK